MAKGEPFAMAGGEPKPDEKARAAALPKPIFRLSPTRWSMLDNEKLQIAGPIGVIATVTGAQIGMHALAYWPSSSLLWFIDLEVFRPVQYSFLAENTAYLGDLAQTLTVVLPLLALMCVGFMAQLRLPLAIASNMSLVYGSVLLYASFMADSPIAQTGSRLNALRAPSFFLAVSVLFVALLSSAVSHRAYWREIFS
jgi:hypothetical protein